MSVSLVGAPVSHSAMGHILRGSYREEKLEAERKRLNKGFKAAWTAEVGSWKSTKRRSTP